MSLNSFKNFDVLKSPCPQKMFLNSEIFGAFKNIFTVLGLLGHTNANRSTNNTSFPLPDVQVTVPGVQVITTNQIKNCPLLLEVQLVS